MVRSSAIGTTLNEGGVRLPANRCYSIDPKSIDPLSGALCQRLRGVGTSANRLRTPSSSGVVGCVDRAPSCRRFRTCRVRGRSLGDAVWITGKRPETTTMRTRRMPRPAPRNAHPGVCPFGFYRRISSNGTDRRASRGSTMIGLGRHEKNGIAGWQR